MKGVILAGGSGSRLRPITQYLNKHLFPVYNKPMILFPIETMKRIGIYDIIVVTDRFRGDKIVEFLGSGKDFGVSITYKFQEKPDGIGKAIKISESLIGNDNVIVMLGDNIVFDDLTSTVREFKGGCSIFLKEVFDPERFGVPKFDSQRNIIRIIEKPAIPPSKYAVTGIYIFDSSVFNKIDQCSPSARGELEIVDILEKYVAEKKLGYEILNNIWIDAGTFESLHEASKFVRDLEIKNSLKVG